ncbi:unnamed protein product, partial [Musa hybrid cultivar]
MKSEAWSSCTAVIATTKELKVIIKWNREQRNMKQQQWTLIAGSVSNVHMDMNGEEEDSNQSEVDDGVDHNGDAAGLQVAELDQAALAGGLEHEARREKNEQYHCHEHWPPVCH